jgi:hypothetical protein
MVDVPRPGPEPPESQLGSQKLDPGGPFLEEEVVLARKDIIAELAEAVEAAERKLAAAPRETADERARRLDADIRLVAALRQENFDGPLFKRLAQEMAGYGWPIIAKWLGNGEIFRRVWKCRCRIRRHSADQDWTADDRNEITTDTILAGVEVFKRQLQNDRWDPQKGASLKTYFIGACVCAFCQVYGVWRREQIFTDGMLHYACIDDLEATTVAVGYRPAGPEEVAVVGDLVDRTIKPMRDRDLRRIVGLIAIGYTQQEAAAETGITAKAAERRLARFRRRLGPLDSSDDGRGER